MIIVVICVRATRRAILYRVYRMAALINSGWHAADGPFNALTIDPGGQIDIQLNIARARAYACWSTLAGSVALRV